MAVRRPKLIATSVVRGSQQGESHGGVFTVDDFISQQALGIRRDHVERVGIDLCRLAEFTDSKAAGEHDLTILDDAN